MKKLMLMTLAMAMLFPMVACSSNDDDDAPTLGASVKVTVKNLLGITHKGYTVYMYKDREIDKDTQKDDGVKSAVTDENGVATFSLRFHELNIIESQTSLYFAVFYTIDGNDFVIGSAGVTVKRNDEKEIVLKTAL